MQRRAEAAPGEVLAWEMLGYLHSLRGEHAAATEAFGKAVVTGAGQDNNALCLLGSSLSQQKQHSQAERVFKAATASSEATRAWAGLARCQCAQGAHQSLFVFSEECGQSVARGGEILVRSQQVMPVEACSAFKWVLVEYLSLMDLLFLWRGGELCLVLQGLQGASSAHVYC